MEEGEGEEGGESRGDPAALDGDGVEAGAYGCGWEEKDP